MTQKLFWSVELTASISNHTILVNAMIGLSKKTTGWPSTLKDMGYNVEYIEPTFLNADGQKVNPDILFTSNKQMHALVIECKGGKTIEDEQINKYARINKNSLIDRVSVKEPTKLTHDVSIVGLEQFSEPILLKVNGSFPVIIFTFEKQIEKHNSFSHKKLNDAFSHPINIGYPPTEFYPFDDEDDESWISMYVLQELFSLSLGNSHSDNLDFTEEQLLRQIHPMWSQIHESKKKKLKAKVNTILNSYHQKGLSKQLQSIRGKNRWQIKKPLDSFTENCKKLVDDLGKQKTIGYFDTSDNSK